MAYVKNSMINIPGFGLTPRAEPNSASAGQIYYDATADLIYGYDGTSWVALSNQHIAFGGDIITYAASGVTYVVHTFRSSSSFVSRGAIDVDYLVVAGGGGGGSMGAGGAGGFRTAAALSVSAQSYAVTVGAGGVGVGTVGGTNGGDSVISTITSAGGGGGGAFGSPEE